MLVKKHNEIDSQKDTIKSLSNKIFNLEALFNSNTSQPSQAMETESSATINCTATQQTLTVINDSKNKLLPRGILPGERKFNIIIYGVAECPNATPRPERQKSDLANCLNIVSKLNDEIDSHSI